MGRNVGEIVGIFFIYFLLFYCYRLINTFLTSFRIIEAWWILVENKHHIGSRFKKRQPKWLTWLLCRNKLLQEKIVFASKLFNSYLDHFLMTPLFFIYIFFIYQKKKKIVFWWLEYYLYFVDNEKIVISLSILWRKFWNYFFSLFLIYKIHYLLSTYQFHCYSISIFSNLVVMTPNWNWLLGMLPYLPQFCFDGLTFIIIPVFLFFWSRNWWTKFS